MWRWGIDGCSRGTSLDGDSLGDLRGARLRDYLDDVRRALEEVGEKPVLVLVGEKDRSWTPSRLAETARVFDARLEVVEGSGHDLMLDVGWRAAAASIAGWLEERLGGMGLHSVGS